MCECLPPSPGAICASKLHSLTCTAAPVALTNLSLTLLVTFTQRGEGVSEPIVMDAMPSTTSAQMPAAGRSLSGGLGLPVTAMLIGPLLA